MIGSRLGPYEITAKLGEGGMGEVYRATDTKLKREVAIKVLPGAFVADPERLARFEREAQLLAQLHHPKIASIFGLEESGGVKALVMELVEGPTLAERLGKGGLPLDESLAIARQVAEALEAAHEKGIVHRDLKPQNVKVAIDGTVKVLDFGLAKALDPVDSPSSPAVSPTLMHSPTLTAAGTQLGVILGTAAYMAPEQAKGATVDKRADVWAFGVLLWEMLTGRRLFEGDSVPETLAGVLKSDIDLRQLPAETPPELRRLLRRCLARNPKNRLHDIADARLVLDELAAGSSEEAVFPAALAPAPFARRPALWIAAALLLAAGIGVGVWLGARARGRAASEAPPAPLRFVVPAPEGIDAIRNPELSRDGSLLLFAGASEEGRRLFVHRFATGETSALTDLEAPSTWALSPDGRWIVYASGGRMFKRALGGGEPLSFCATCEIGSGAAWLDDGSILFNPTWLDGLWIVTEGGEPRRLTTPDTKQGEKGHWFPRPLPGGTHALFTIFTAGAGINDTWIALLDLASGDYRRLLPGADAQYQPPGHLLFYRAGAYHAVGFDLASLAVRGTPVRALDDVKELEPQGTELRHVSAGATGALAYLPGSIAEPSRLAWVAAGGAPELLPFEERAWGQLALAPNGRDVVATALESGALALHRLDLESGSDERLSLPGSNWGPYFRGDGAAVAYTSMRKGDFDVYLLPLFESGGEQALLTGPEDEIAHGWSPDGASLVVEISRPDGSYPLVAAPLAGGEKRLLVDRPFVPDEADLSPDGRWLLFLTRHTGRSELYVQPADRSGGALRVTRQGGSQPRWSPDGRTIFYRKRDAIFAADFRLAGGRPQVGGERKLVEGPFVDVDAPLATNDGKRFLVPLRTAARAPAEIAIVIGWSHEVAARLERER